MPAPADVDVSDLLDDLTPPQRAAVTHASGPLLILAGAGSGKTRVLTRRVAHLVRTGAARPRAILAITFTNKAAGEMKARVGATLGRKMWDFGQLDTPGPTICTFHSLCLRVLRAYHAEAGLPQNFAIYDSADQSKLVKDALKALDLSSTNFSPATVHGRISTAKNQLLSADDFARQAGDFFDRTVARVYLKYQALLAEAGALDFDDLLLRTVDLLRDKPDVTAQLQERFTHVLIDEYQDTNRAQYLLAGALAGPRRNLCVVGDPDQSIYAWRGADLRNILDFEKDYPDATVVKLEHNYRSTKTILRIADDLIARNLQRKEKRLLTDNPAGDRAVLLKCQDERDEALQISRRLQDWHTSGVEWGQMAVFYRVNSLSRVMEEALLRAKVPYQITKGTEFYGRKEIKDALAYLRLIANPSDFVSLERVVNRPARAISGDTLKALQAFALAGGVPLFEALRRADEVSGLNDRAKRAVEKFVAQVETWRAAAGAVGASAPVDMFAPVAGGVRQLLETVLRESGLEALYRKEDPDGENQIANLNELISAAAEYDAEHADPEAGGEVRGSLQAYLAGVALVADADRMEGSGGSVTMMTLHAAKGLEFPAVAMIGLEEGLLPHSRARNSVDELEEERRLCFVGITRAQKWLVLSNARLRTVRGVTERSVPSPFLGELPADALEVVDRTGVEVSADDRRQMDELAPPPKADHGFRKGQQVRHPTFGLGRIEDLGDVGQHTRAVVRFNAAGTKTLILQYAKLTRVG